MGMVPALMRLSLLGRTSPGRVMAQTRQAAVGAPVPVFLGAVCSALDGVLGPRYCQRVLEDDSAY